MREDHLLAPEIGDDALLGAAVLAHVLDQIDVGVAADALVANKHAFSIVKRCQTSTLTRYTRKNLAPHICPGPRDPERFCRSQPKNPPQLFKSGLAVPQIVRERRDAEL